MKAIITILAALLLIGGCSMTEVNLDNEESVVEKTDTTAFKKHKPIKGIVIIPTTTTNS